MKINLPQNEDLIVKKGNTEYELVSVMNDYMTHKILFLDYSEESSDSFDLDIVNDTSISFGTRTTLTIDASIGENVIFSFTFTSPEGAATNLSVPGEWKLLNDELDIKAGYTYEFSIQNNLCAYGKFTTTQDDNIGGNE